MACSEGIINHTLILIPSCCFFFLCFIGFIPYCSNAAEPSSITQGQQIQDWEHLVSAGGIFRLGFFSPNSFTYSSKDRYLGIWYAKDPSKNIAWVANRNTPISDSSGVLTIDADGRLKITYSGGSPVFLNTYPNQTAPNATATLLDSGNFVVTVPGTLRVLWQSFDYPTDALLPGMKLGVNLKTGHKWSLTSWLSQVIPAAGAFTLGGDPNGTTQLVVWRRGEVYWRSGLWLNNNTFEFYPSFPHDGYFREHYSFSYVSNGDEKYFTFSVKDEDISMFSIALSGDILENKNAVGPFGMCDFNPQCVGLKLPQCRSLQDSFVMLKGYMDGEAYLNEGDPNMALSDCEDKCWSNCSCVAYASANDNETGCKLWSRGLTFTEFSDGSDVFRLASYRKIKWWIWFTIAVASALAILLFPAFCYFIRRKLRQRGEKASQEKLLLELGANVTSSDKFSDANGDKKGPDMKIFGFASIVAATNNFSSENKLGQGGFGPVYKGKLLNGKEIAVKRLSRSSGQGLVEFKNEIMLIAKLQHTNLVRLFGCCLQGEEKMLIYEYMPNKSLDFFLFDPVRKELLDWKRRLNIIEGIAQGLLYLHKYSRLRVIHRDLKASNVLLDSEMNPKISDFGMARIFGQNESEANTNRVVGTYGYMSPEYAMEGIFSVKSDVFSFGILLLEIVSGRKNSSFYHLERPLNLVGYTWELWKEGTISELLDQSLVASCQKHEFLRLTHLGLLCVQESAKDRPSMSYVISVLSTEAMPLPPPKQPAFSTERSMTETDIPNRKPENCSINRVSISTMEAR